MNLKFRWNKAKARENYRKHGVTFDLAKAVFNDARLPWSFWMIVAITAKSGSWIIGMVEGRILYVAYSERDDVIRMISARRATKHEEQAYYEQGWWETSKDDTRRH